MGHRIQNWNGVRVPLNLINVSAHVLIHKKIRAWWKWKRLVTFSNSFPWFFPAPICKGTVGPWNKGSALSILHDCLHCLTKSTVRKASRGIVNIKNVLAAFSIAFMVSHTASSMLGWGILKPNWFENAIADFFYGFPLASLTWMNSNALKLKHCMAVSMVRICFMDAQNRGLIGKLLKLTLLSNPFA